VRLKTGKGKYYTFKGRQRGIRGAGKTDATNTPQRRQFDMEGLGK